MPRSRLFRQVGGGGATGLDEGLRPGGEDGARRAGGGPDDVEGQQVAVAVDGQALGVAEGRHAADGEAGGALDLVGASAAYLRGAGDHGEAGAGPPGGGGGE